MSISDQFKPAGEGTRVRDIDLDLSAIKLDQSAQPRESLNNDRIAEYAEGMKVGDQFPPLTVFHDGSTYWLADGFHRHYAAQHAGRKHIRCYVRQGGLREAILWSVGANAKHGLARSDEDKKRAVMRLLEDAEWSTWTDRDIAKRCRVSHPFVAKIRKAHAGVTGNITSERTYRTKHGTTATMKTAGINASRKVADDEPKEITQETHTAQAVEADGEPEKPVEEITSKSADMAVGLAGPACAHDDETANTKPAPRNIVAEILALWALATPAQQKEIRAAIGTVDPKLDTPTIPPSAAISAVPAPVAPSPNPAGAVPHFNPQPNSSPDADMAGEPQDRNEPVSGSPAKPFVLRPHCLHPELCAGSGSKHCWSCTKAMEGEAA